MCCGLGAGGRIARPTMAPPRPSTIASTVGAFGGASSSPCRRRRNCPVTGVSAPPLCAPSGRLTAEKGGAKVQAPFSKRHRGCSRGGPIPEIHALTDTCGRMVAVIRGPGSGADISAAPTLPARIPAPARLLADTGYDADSLRARLAATRTEAVIPASRSRKTPIPHDAAADIARNMIERAFCRLKDWRRIGKPLRQACNQLRVSRRHRRRHSQVDLIES